MAEPNLFEIATSMKQMTDDELLDAIHTGTKIVADRFRDKRSSDMEPYDQAAEPAAHRLKDVPLPASGIV